MTDKKPGKKPAIKEYRYSSNKDVVIKKIKGLLIDNFRKFNQEQLDLGGVLTVLVGKNGTMKSTLLGMVGEVFRSSEKDIHDTLLKVSMNDIFNWSNNKDNKNYDYRIKMLTDKDETLIENVEHRFRSNDGRHRIIVSGSNKGEGQFNLPVSYISLKRLYPLIDADSRGNSDYIYSHEENKVIKGFYQKVLNRDDFDNFASYDTAIGKNHKYPKGPDGENTAYDIESISAGEDNLSTFIDQIISLNKISDISGNLTGIMLIDEFESTLHPTSQIALLDFIYRWAQKNNVQVVLTTHSLFLIQSLLLNDAWKERFDDENIVLNLIETLYEVENKFSITKNPSYAKAYEELTLERETSKALKIKIILEDEMAKRVLSSFIPSKKRAFISYEYNINESKENEGTGKQVLHSLAKNFSSLLSETNSMIIFDPDVGEKEYGKLMKNKNVYNYVYVFPSSKTGNNQCFEVEILLWLLELDASDDLFVKKLNKSKDSMKQSMTDRGASLSKESYGLGTNESRNAKKWFESLEAREQKKLITNFKNYKIKEKQYQEFLKQIDDFIIDTFNKMGLKVPSIFKEG
ncbi:AAA family ATPase [Lactococcus garvieae]|nr:AAA family ATPase [Lactococcus garvieae]